MNEWWIRREGKTIAIGLTDEALKQLGCIWQWIPRVHAGDTVFKGQGIATIQTMVSLKSMTSPIAGRVVKIYYTDRANCLSSKQELFTLESDALQSL